MNRTLLFIIDVQNDFLPGGALAVPNGDEIIDEIIKAIQDPHVTKILCSQDWHPQDHTSFAVNHGIEPFNMVGNEMKWPVHCVAGTPGADIQSQIKTALYNQKVGFSFIKKGMDTTKEEYSAATKEVIDIIKTSSCNEIKVVGLATDYCVKATVLDLLEKVPQSIFIDCNAIRGVAPETSQLALEEMKIKGAKIFNA